MNFFKNNHADIEEPLKRMRQYFGSKVDDKRIELYASRLASKGFKREQVTSACEHLIDNNKFFPALSEIVEIAYTKILKPKDSNEKKGCNKCNYNGFLILKDGIYQHVYKCNCDKGSNYPSYDGFDDYIRDRDTLNNKGETNGSTTN